MIKNLPLLGLVLVFNWLILLTPAQATGCDHTLPLTTYKIDGSESNVQPGDVVCLQSGTRGTLRLESLIGTEANPIIIQNSGGQLLIEADNTSIFVLKSKHIRLTGTGSTDHFYGIKATGTVKVDGLTSNVEVDHLEISNPNPAGFAGMMVKTDPTCDPATWRENFTMYDVSLHDNYIHNVARGEGFYIGFTFYDGYQRTCDGKQITVYGHIIDGLEVYNNILEDIGSEGIQISSIPNGAQVYNNVIRKYGQRPFDLYQDNGVQIGQGNAEVYNNLIDEGVGTAFSIFGTGHKFYNNIILNSGKDAIFLDDRRVGNGITFVNNTIINPGRNGITTYNDEAVTDNIIKNNIIVKADNAYEFIKVLNNNVPVDISHNLTAAGVETIDFVNSSQKDYRLRSSSPAINGGTDVSSLGINQDYIGTGRPKDGGYDQGAYEYKRWLNFSAQAADQMILLSWETDPLPTDATWTLSFDGPSTAQSSPLTNLSPDMRTYDLIGLTNFTPYTLTLQAVISGSAVLTETVTARPTNIFIYLPAIQKP